MIKYKIPCSSMGSLIKKSETKNYCKNISVLKNQCLNIKSKSTSNIEDLIIEDESQKSIASGIESFMEVLNGKYVTFEKPEYLKRVLVVLEMHHLYIEYVNLKDVISIDDNVSNYAPRLYKHIDFHTFTKCLFQSSETKSANSFYACFIKNLITYMVSTEHIMADSCIFNIGVQKICSLLRSNESHLTEICVVLLKIFREKNVSANEKYQLMLRLNDTHDELTTELSELENINCLSLQSK